MAGILIALAVATFASVCAVVGVAALRHAETALAQTVVVTAGSTLTLGFFVVPLVMGVDDSLDPRKFGLYGIAPRRLASGLAVAALAGLPAIAITAVALAQTVTWGRGGPSAILSLIGAGVIIATAVLGARVMTSVASLLLATRRSREFTGLAALAALAAASPGIALSASEDWRVIAAAPLAKASSVLQWTPLGAAWAAPADAAHGDVGGGVLKLLLALVYLSALWVGWQMLVRWMLASEHPARMTVGASSLGWFDLLPTGPGWSVAARSLTYWIRDARYRTQLAVVPVVPVLLITTFLVGGVHGHTLALLPLPVMALFLSWTVHNDVAYDSSAVWLHVAVDVPGRADRFGRIVPVLVLGVPLIAVGAPISAALAGDGTVLPSLVGVSVGILFGGLGLSSFFSATFPYPAVHPGDSPFSQPQTSGGSASVIQTVVFALTLMFAAPSIWFAYLGLTEGASWPTASLLAGVGVGLLTLGLGVLVGGRIFERRGAELLSFTIRH